MGASMFIEPGLQPLHALVGAPELVPTQRVPPGLRGPQARYEERRAVPVRAAMHVWAL